MKQWQVVGIVSGAVAIGIALALLIAGCQAVGPEPPPAVDVACEAGCRNAKALGCVQGEPTFSGTPCVVVCTDMRREGLRYPAECMAKVSDCSVMSHCK